MFRVEKRNNVPSRISRDPGMINELRGPRLLSSVGELRTCDGHPNLQMSTKDI